MLAWDRFDRPSSFEAKAELAQLAADLSEPHTHTSGVVRIRKPKWTPSLPLDDGHDLVAVDTSDEIEKPKSS